MKYKAPYKNLNHALTMFRKQVSESIPYAMEELPRFSTPEQVFNYLKPRTVYRKDPKGVELFQSLPTLMDNNYHGISGAGDCDCFSTAALSTLLANGFSESGIVLAGRNPLYPKHIWTYTVDPKDGKKKDLDLTNHYYNTTRHYPYIQHIPYKLSENEKAMMLQLEEGGNEGLSFLPLIPIGKFAFKMLKKRRAKKKAAAAARRRRRPVYRQREEGGQPEYRQTYEQDQQPVYNAEEHTTPEVMSEEIRYIPLQSKPGVNVREDFYDNLSHGDFQNEMLSEGIEVSEIAELSSRRSDRVAKRKARRATRQAKRKVRRASVAKGKRKQRARRKEAVGGFFKKAGAGIGGVFSKITGGGEPEEEQPQEQEQEQFQPGEQEQEQDQPGGEQEQPEEEQPQEQEQEQEQEAAPVEGMSELPLIGKVGNKALLVGLGLLVAEEIFIGWGRKRLANVIFHKNK